MWDQNPYVLTFDKGNFQDRNSGKRVQMTKEETRHAKIDYRMAQGSSIIIEPRDRKMDPLYRLSIWTFSCVYYWNQIIYIMAYWISKQFLKKKKNTSDGSIYKYYIKWICDISSKYYCAPIQNLTFINYFWIDI